jgi:hypothetical protein
MPDHVLQPVAKIGLVLRLAKVGFLAFVLAEYWRDKENQAQYSDLGAMHVSSPE